MHIYENHETDEPIEINLEELEEHRKVCKELIDAAKSAIKLADNADFKTLIMEQYFDKEPKRLGCLLASGKLNENQFQHAVNDLKAIGNLTAFLSDIVQKGTIAEESLANAEEAYNEAMAAQE